MTQEKVQQSDSSKQPQRVNNQICPFLPYTLRPNTKEMVTRLRT